VHHIIFNSHPNAEAEPLVAQAQRRAFSLPVFCRVSEGGLSDPGCSRLVGPSKLVIPRRAGGVAVVC
jgi:hypothetical protein